MRSIYVAESHKTNFVLGSRAVWILEGLPMCKCLPTQMGFSTAFNATPKRVWPAVSYSVLAADGEGIPCYVNLRPDSLRLFSAP